MNTAEHAEPWVEDDRELELSDPGGPCADELTLRRAATVQPELAELTTPRLLTPARPTALTALLSPDRGVERHRRLFCDRYDDCLDHAVACRWVSWTCAHCPLFAPADEMLAAAQVLRAAARPVPTSHATVGRATSLSSGPPHPLMGLPTRMAAP